MQFKCLHPSSIIEIEIPFVISLGEMPELPEVETIKNELSPWIAGQSFTQAALLDKEILRQCSVEEFQHLVGQRIETLGRRGKYLLFHLSSKQSLIMHFGMTGTLLLNPKRIAHYARAVFHLSNGSQLVFNDQRRLGAIWLLENATLVTHKLGPEPLSQNFTPPVLAGLLHKHRIPVKAALLDQNLIAGIGNMYADEALFAARIHPLKKTHTLSTPEIQTLFYAIRDVLQSAIDSKGATVDTYIRPQGQLGTAQFNFKVAHRYAKPCPACGTTIQRILVRGRGTHFCPHCQHLNLSTLPKLI